MNRTIKVLVVEDSEDDAKLAIRTLRQGGFDPSYRRVQDVQALKAAFESERWDAVLSDFRLPGFTGVDALEVFRGTGLDIPFIFFSGTIGEETAVAAMKAGASDYVMKQHLARLAPVLERELAQAAIRAEHRKGQLELVASRDRFVDLYDFAPVGYLTLSADGLIAQVNLTAATLLRTPRESLVGARLDQFMLALDRQRWHRHCGQTLQYGQQQRIELALQGGQGSSLHVQLDCLRVGPDVRVVMTDISERKEAEAVMRRFENQLREVQKMESIGTLAGGIAHDFNNILGAILGNVALARDDVGAGHPALVSLAEIHKASMRARNLVQQILSFSRREAQELVTQPLRPVVEETCKLLRATLPARVALEITLAEQPLHVLADATQVQQVLMNLCTNAWQALKDGGGRIGIGLDAAELDLAAGQRLGGVPAGPYAHLWVSDNGVGMDAATRERVFEPFFTTKPVGQGTGLGLSVVHGILRAHHAASTIESAPGQGCTFHLYFPLAAPPPAAVAVAPAEPVEPAGAVPSAPVGGRGQHVVYVDDDATMVILVERILERAGYRVSTYERAQQAIAAVRAQPEGVDLVVTDFNMPDVSGLELARELRRIRPGLPVVISSGYITQELRDEAHLAGVHGLLEKQNTFQELSSLVGHILSA